MNHPTVSVIIPNYNHEAFLRQRIESVLQQTWQDFELILLDDASTDASQEILCKYRNHKKVTHLVFNQQNSGSPFAQWSNGIDLAAGRYIWIAESDDWAEPTLLERLMEKTETGASLIYCRSQKVDQYGEILNQEFWADSLDDRRWTSDFVNNARDELANYLCYRNTIPNASACLFVKKPDLFTETILNSRFTGDWLFWVHYLSKTIKESDSENPDIAFVGDRLNYHRTHSGTTRNHKQFDDKRLRLTERLNAIRLARSVTGQGRIRLSEIQGYKYILRSLVDLKNDSGRKRASWRGVPVELRLYARLFEAKSRLRSLSGRHKGASVQ